MAHLEVCCLEPPWACCWAVGCAVHRQPPAGSPSGSALAADSTSPEATLLGGPHLVAELG